MLYFLKENRLRAFSLLEHFAFENALQAMRRHGLPPRRRRRNSLAPSTPERAS
ncbi:hypothetical protein V6C53_11570 [Desulfocurvibacter africanus]|uniref:hypothetical protein n=1 Tax=Desulfocurvibacter africanus TaxID=873 RepID=UPI0012B54557|nr:hypothetical protein [Desulfocurvibacter africanus]